MNCFFFQLWLSKHPLPDRDGTEVDVDKITSTFKKLSYKVIARDDLNHSELLAFITNTVQEHFIPEKHSSILLFILTHGLQGKNGSFSFN